MFLCEVKSDPDAKSEEGIVKSGEIQENESMDLIVQGNGTESCMG